MTKRKLLLLGAGLVVLLGAGALRMAATADEKQGFNLSANPMTQIGGPIETTLRIVPPLHDALWPSPTLNVFC